MGTSDRKIDRAMEGKRLTLTGVFKAQSDLFRFFVRSSISQVRLKSALLAKKRVKRVIWRRRVLSKWVLRKGEVPLSKIWLLDFVPIRKG